MKRTNSKKHLLIVLFLILSLVFTACSSAKNDAATTDKATTEAGSTGDSKVSTILPATSSSVKDGGGSEVTAKTDVPVTTSSPESPKEAPEAYKYADGDVLMESSFAMKDAGTMDMIAGAEMPVSEKYEGDDVIVTDPTERPQVKAGILTAGEWNDNQNFDFIKNLLNDGQSYDYKDFFTKWDIAPFNRLAIKVTGSDESFVQGANVTVYDGNGTPVWKGVTDYEGMLYAYYSLLDSSVMPAKVTAEYNGVSVDYDVVSDDLKDSSVISLTLDAEPKMKTLDLMFTVDTTGSMGDEIFYLQEELQDVIKRVQNDTANIPVRLSVNFYRDLGDEYVVRPYEFSTNINEQLAYLNKEYATGGGDFEEAVEQALANCVNEHSWNADSIKILFLVLDAPPHNTLEIRQSLIDTISKASEMGIRIIPVASSGIDKDTEFLLRAFAMTTGGTYTFLTDDSGVGESHLEPTVGQYEVEQLNDLLVRLIEKYIG